MVTFADKHNAGLQSQVSNFELAWHVTWKKYEKGRKVWSLTSSNGLHESISSSRSYPFSYRLAGYTGYASYDATARIDSEQVKRGSSVLQSSSPYLERRAN